MLPDRFALSREVFAGRIDNPNDQPKSPGWPPVEQCGVAVNSNFWLDKPRGRVVGSDQRDVRVGSELVRHLTPNVRGVAFA